MGSGKNQVDTLTDPRRTIEACQLYDLVHVTIIVDRQFKTRCGMAVTRGNLLMLLQRPEDITCPECKKERL